MILVLALPMNNELNEFLEVCLKLPFNLISQLNIAFYHGQPWRVLKSWYITGAPEQVFQCRFSVGLSQMFSFVCGAGYVV